jgi:Fur family ferric uptake transcriptional regulator
MHIHKDSVSFEVLLRERGFRATPARTKLLEILCAADAPLSVVDILSIFSKDKYRVNKTTIYRDLEFLRDEEIVSVVRVDDAKVLYEIRSHSHHHHAVCTRCGVLIDIANTTLEKAVILLSRAIKRRTGFVAREHSVEMFGLCKQCQTRAR